MRRSVDAYEEPFLKTCCDHGLHKDDKGRNCATRVAEFRKNTQGPDGVRCAKAFAECCSQKWDDGE